MYPAGRFGSDDVGAVCSSSLDTERLRVLPFRRGAIGTDVVGLAVCATGACCVAIEELIWSCACMIRSHCCSCASLSFVSRSGDTGVKGTKGLTRFSLHKL